MLDTLSVRIMSKHRLINKTVRAEQKGLLFTLWEPVLVFGFGVMCLRGL